MLKKCACGGRVGPEGCEEGRGAKAQPRGYTENRGWPTEQGCIKDTKLNHWPCLLSSPPLALIAYFQKDQHEGKQQSLHYCCYHFQTAIFKAKTNSGVYDVYARACTGTCMCLCSQIHFVKQHTPFHSILCVYQCWFSLWRVIFCPFPAASGSRAP